MNPDSIQHITIIVITVISDAIVQCCAEFTFFSSYFPFSFAMFVCVWFPIWSIYLNNSFIIVCKLKGTFVKWSDNESAMIFNQYICIQHSMTCARTLTHFHAHRARDLAVAVTRYYSLFFRFHFHWIVVTALVVVRISIRLITAKSVRTHQYACAPPCTWYIEIKCNLYSIRVVNVLQ